jgi:hypothetical protein
LGGAALPIPIAEQLMNPFFQEAPTETRMYPCPVCEEIITVGNASCRYCGATIDEATAGRLNAAFQRVTDAVASANTFKQSIWAAVFLTVASPIFLFGMGQPNPRLLLVSAAPIGFLAYAITWRRKYGGLETGDEDYPEAVRAMNRSLLVWVTSVLIQVAVLMYALSSRVFDR